jgi:hypothetical protein
MNKPMSTRQVRNAVKTLNLVLETGKDIKINGDFRGSSGFITNAAKNIFVYYNTESSCLSSLAGKILVRAAKSACDYTGGRNEFAEPEKFLDTVNWYFKNNYTPDRVQRI